MPAENRIMTERKRAVKLAPLVERLIAAAEEDEERVQRLAAAVLDGDFSTAAKLAQEVACSKPTATRNSQD